jgi:predicted MFS family arabinose efflux permease
MGRLVDALVGRGPFRRLVLANSGGVAGDAIFTVSLAGSLFFNVSVDAARPSILLYLVVTLAPFAIVGPFVGRIIDRFPGSQRGVMAVTNAGRALAMLAMSWHRTSLLFFPLAFVVLVLSKSSSVAKSSLVPWLVPEQSRLVAENARLSRMTAITAGCAGVIGAVVMQVADARAVLWLAAAVQFGAIWLALRVPQIAVPGLDRVIEDVELRLGELSLAANSLCLVRGAVGCLTFLIAFALKVAGQPAWVFGFVMAAGGIGAFVGTYVAAYARRHVREELLLTAALGVAGAVTIVTGVQYQPTGAITIGFVVGVAACVGRQAFDSLTQRLAPDAEKGRAFARFETRFQVAWVSGALIAVLSTPRPRIGLAVLGTVLMAGAALYMAGWRTLRRQHPAVDRDASDLADSLLALASALQAQHSDRLAISTAVEAARVAALEDGHCERADLPAELARIWRQAALGNGALPAGAAQRAVDLATDFVTARRRTRTVNPRFDA